MDKELLLKYYRCQTSEEEERRIAEWLDASAENRADYALFRMRMDAVTMAGSTIDELYETHRRRGVRRSLRRWSVAAAAALVFGLGVSYLTATHVRREVGSTMLTFSSQDAPVRYTLSDGTSVWLNTRTSIEFPAVFTGRERTVRVTGEALFDVTHDPERPFVVCTPSCDVRVLGTQFNIRTDADGSRFEAALLRGRIEVMNRATGGRLVLEPNQTALLRDGVLVQERLADPDDYLCMADGYINLKGHTFCEVLDRIGQVFGVQIDSEGVSVGDDKFWWGKIRVQDGVDNAMKVLQNAYPVRYTYDRESNTIVVRNK